MANQQRYVGVCLQYDSWELAVARSATAAITASAMSGRVVIHAPGGF